MSRGSLHIHGMTRADLRTLAWLMPLALVLVFWWMFRADPCLDNEIGNHLRAMNPPAAESVVAEPNAPDATVVERPYGIQTCHYWPDALDHTTAYAALVGIALFIGFLSARNFQQRARIRAAVITFVVLSLALAISLAVYLPDNLDHLERWEYGPLFKAASIVLAMVLGVAAIAGFAAWLTLRFRPRAPR